MLYSLPMSVAFDPKSYEQMCDGDLLRIAMDRAELTPEAGAAFDAELAKRGLGEEQVRSFAISYRAEVAAEERAREQRGPQTFMSRRGIGTTFYGRRDLKE